MLELAAFRAVLVCLPGVCLGGSLPLLLVTSPLTTGLLLEEVLAVEGLSRVFPLFPPSILIRDWRKIWESLYWWGPQQALQLSSMGLLHFSLMLGQWGSVSAHDWFEPPGEILTGE